MKVVWDIKKGAANFSKHKVEFSHASTTLDAPAALTIEDKRHDERRFITVGSDILGRVLVVVYTYEGEAEIRLISARKATRTERRFYEKKG